MYCVRSTGSHSGGLSRRRQHATADRYNKPARQRRRPAARWRPIGTLNSSRSALDEWPTPQPAPFLRYPQGVLRVLDAASESQLAHVRDLLATLRDTLNQFG